MTDPEDRTGATFGADAAHHLVRLRRWQFIPGHPTHGVTDLDLLSPEAALELAEALTRSARGAMARALTDARRGDCATCHNRRLIDLGSPRGDVYCPDCTDYPGDPRAASGPSSARPLPAIPTLPAWEAIEREVLGGD